MVQFEPRERDWARTPAGMVAAIVLGLASVGGLGWSITRSMQADRLAMTMETQRLEDGRSAESLQSSLSVRQRVEINSADSAELELLPRIGPKLAQKIIDYRSAHGPFDRLEDLDHVPGIGLKTIEGLRADAMVGD
ncbi:MAG: ComEA family DNA-binding protein [Phycisphaerales bacterium]